MSPERYQRIKQLFEAVVGQPDGSRGAFLDRECGDDPQLRSQIESMLESDQEGADFLEAPAVVSFSRLLNREPESLVGQRIGPYKILRELGKGGMAVVYQATRDDLPSNSTVAIKFIKSSAGSDIIARRFRQERQILAALEHPNIAQLLDGGTLEDCRPFFVMEYVEGKPIDVYAREHKLDLRPRLELFLSVCSAVEYAHQNLVIHRDLKPANILVRGDSTVKLLDFGIAKLLNPSIGGGAADKTASGIRLMTPEYASPEQLRGEPVTTVSDIYLLGIVLYELLTGHRPFRTSGNSAVEAMRALAERAPEKPSVVAAGNSRRPGEPPKQNPLTPDDLAGDVDAITLKALERDPARRYSSASELAQDIRRHLDGNPVLARSHSLPHLFRKLMKRPV